MSVRVLDLDGSFVAQRPLMDGLRPEVISLREWGPRIRMACSFGRFREFSEGLPASAPLTLIGSGDFHHVSLALVAAIREPINLIVLDKHPDWVRGVPFLHCGTWVAHALRLPHVARLFHFGGDLDFDNYYRHAAPVTDIRSGRAVVFPAERRYRTGLWRSIPHEPLRAEAGVSSSREWFRELLAPHAAELAARPVYVSIDKDVMVQDDAVVNWDSGRLELSEVEALVRVLVELAGKPVAADLVGDWSAVNMSGPLRWFLDQWEHPRLDVQPERAAEVNSRTNLALAQALGLSN